MKIFGNWKMYLNYDESIAYAEQLKKEKFTPQQVTGSRLNSGKDKNIELAVFPTSLALSDVAKVLNGESISIGAQNCAWTQEGAYTGAVSASMFKEVGCKYVLVGHSERRHIYGESNEDIRKKLEAVLEVGLVPVLCIGETSKDREEDKVKYRLKKQLMKALEGLKVESDKIIVAYEPVWAIGTGKPCSRADTDSVHGWIKQELKQYIKGEVALLYGGSINAQNVVQYVTLETVDGVLVGGASVKLDSFKSLVDAVKAIS